MANTVIHKDLKSFLGNRDHLEISEQKSFAELIFISLSEHQPTDVQLKLFNLILNLSIDHGPDTPSAIEVIKAAREKTEIGQAVASGVIKINNQHGGAIEPAMEIFYKVKDQGFTVQKEIKTILASGQRLPGFGHRLYKTIDPRAQLIFKKLQEAGLGKEFIKIAQDLEQELKLQTDKHLPLNIDGAIAVMLCAFDWDPKLGKAFFISARTPGLCAHYLNNTP